MSLREGRKILWKWNAEGKEWYAWEEGGEVWYCETNNRYEWHDKCKVGGTLQDLVLESLRVLEAAALQAPKDVERWVSVEERLPENDQYVLVYTETEYWYLAGWDGEFWCDGRGVIQSAATHWQELPAPPTATPTQDREAPKGGEG